MRRRSEKRRGAAARGTRSGKRPHGKRVLFKFLDAAVGEGAVALLGVRPEAGEQFLDGEGGRVGGELSSGREPLADGLMLSRPGGGVVMPAAVDGLAVQHDVVLPAGLVKTQRRHTTIPGGILRVPSSLESRHCSWPSPFGSGSIYSLFLRVTAAPPFPPVFAQLANSSNVMTGSAKPKVSEEYVLRQHRFRLAKGDPEGRSRSSCKDMETSRSCYEGVAG